MANIYHELRLNYMVSLMSEAQKAHTIALYEKDPDGFNEVFGEEYIQALRGTLHVDTSTLSAEQLENIYKKLQEQYQH